MKKLLLILSLFLTTFVTKAQDSYQNVQDVINEISAITGSEDIQMQYLDTINQTKINESTEIEEAGHKGLFLLRIRATDFKGTIDFYLYESPILQLTTSRSIDTGNIYIICTSYDALGIQDNSGTVTIEGYKYTPNLQ